MSNWVVTSPVVALESGTKSMSGFGRDDDAGGVGRGVARRALEPPRDVDQLLDLRVVLVGVLRAAATPASALSSVILRSAGISFAILSTSA